MTAVGTGQRVVAWLASIRLVRIERSLVSVSPGWRVVEPQASLIVPICLLRDRRSTPSPFCLDAGLFVNLRRHRFGNALDEAALHVM